MRSLHSASLATALLLLPVSLHAQNNGGRPEVPLATSLHGPAKEAYVSAELLFNNGDYAGSVIKYRTAYDLSKDPRLLFDMALAEKSLRAYSKMQQLLEQYERESGARISPEDKAAVTAALGAIHNLVGTVALEANVQGADVAVDGEHVGTTPLSAPLVLDLGEHRISARKDGFETATKTVRISGGAALDVVLTLAAQEHTGQLVVSAAPGTTIGIDGHTAATEQFEGMLPVGPHDVTVSGPDKEPFETTVEIHDHETRTLQVTLLDRKHEGSVWPWLVGGGVAVAGASVGGYFLFRSHETTTSAVPMAPLFNVKLSSWWQ